MNHFIENKNKEKYLNELFNVNNNSKKKSSMALAKKSLEERTGFLLVDKLDYHIQSLFIFPQYTRKLPYKINQALSSSMYVIILSHGLVTLF